MKYLIIIPLLFISACASLKLATFDDSQATQLKPGHGLLALSINTIDKINHVYVLSSNAGADFSFDKPPFGSSLHIFEVPEGDYCLHKVTLGKGSIKFKSTTSHDARGFCTYVEAGTIAYSGDIYLRINAYVIKNYPWFVSRLNQSHPNVCHQFIGDSCDE